MVFRAELNVLHREENIIEFLVLSFFFSSKTKTRLEIYKDLRYRTTWHLCSGIIHRQYSGAPEGPWELHGGDWGAWGPLACVFAYCVLLCTGVYVN